MIRKTGRFIVASLLLVGVLSGCGKSEREIADFDDAAQAKIGVMTGAIGETIAAQRFPQAQRKSFDDIMDAVAAMKSGQIEAIITAYPTALQLVKTNPDLKRLPEPLDNEDTAIALRKSDGELLAQVDRVIGELKDEGTLADMKKRWFKTDTAPYEDAQIALPKDGKALRVGVSATREPFSFVDKNGRVSGHDGELARRIGARLQRPVEFLDMKFMALIPALQSGKVDLIISGINITDERKKAVAFSQPYFANSQVMLVRQTRSEKTALKQGAAADAQIVQLPQIDGRRICVLTGSAGDLAARKHFPRASFQDLTLAADAALAVRTGKADAFVYDKSVLLKLAEKNPELVILDQAVDKLEVAAAIASDNTVLLGQINATLAELKKEGVLQGLRAKWVDGKSAASPLPPVDEKPAEESADGVLKLGTSAVIEPFSFQSGGVYTGLDIELGRLIGERLGKRVEIVDLPFESLIPALQTGKIDFALANFNVTEERKKFVSFSVPYLENDISALVRRAVPSAAGLSGSASAGLRLSSPADLKDKRIALLLGSVHDKYAAEHYPGATVMQYKSPSDLLLAVKSGKADAGMYTRETLIEILRADPDLALLGDSLFSVPIAIGFNKDNAELRQAFNTFLREIRSSGVYADMVERWIAKGETRLPPIAKSGANGLLVVGNVSDKGMPFTAVKDNALVGFDIELAERFGAYLGREVRFSDMDFGSLIAAVSTNKIDMIASTLMITAERSEQIGFSDPYYELGANVFALRKNIASAGAGAGAAVEAKAAPPGFFAGIASSFESNILQENRYLLIWDGLQTTVIISVLATVFGTLLGALVCYLRMSRRILLSLPAKLYIAVLRGTPVLVLLMLIFYVVFASVDISPVLVAVIAFGMNFAAYSAEIFRTGIDGVDKGQTEAGVSLGFTRVETFINIVLPQTVRRILPVYRGEFISLVKMTSVVGYIAVQDLTKASDIIRSRTFDAFFPLVMIAILYFLISWVLMQSLEYLERRLDPKRRKAAQA